MYVGWIIDAEGRRLCKILGNPPPSHESAGSSMSCLGSRGPAVTNIPFQHDAVHLSRAEFYGCCQSYWPPSDTHDNRLVKVVHQIPPVFDFHTFLSSCPAPAMLVFVLPGCPLGFAFAERNSV